MSSSLSEKFDDFVGDITEMKNQVNAGASPADKSHLPSNTATQIGSAPVKPFEGGSSVEHVGGFDNVGAKAASAVGQSKTAVNAGAGKGDAAPKLKAGFPGDKAGKSVSRGGGDKMAKLGKTFVEEEEKVEDQLIERKEEEEEEEEEGGKKKSKLRKRMEEALRLVEKKKEEGEEEEEEEEEEEAGGKKKVAKKAWKESIDVSTDVAALLEGENLSETFASKATTIFEAALVSKLAEHAEMLEEHYSALVAEHIEVIKGELTEKVDSFLNYVVEQWMEDNKLAIEHGLRAEIAESFISGLRGLFEEHHIEVPEEKYDIVEGMAEKLDEMEQKLNEQIEKNIEINASLGEFVKESIVAEISQGLAETQKEKLSALAEGVEFTSEEAYREKIETIKENYFPKTQVNLVSEASDPVMEEQVPAHMAAYVNALSRWSK
jgi:hypothetical protein